ncbi:probable LRR receptor-like serine/threonine-protein kinase At1g56140 [Pistacia vera]|uniref:probable LRR receptor-like serine/threonine-protein kinase At1g56140 n=1 Tax=Pistacia vera TaxID=55513 RepID=UPI001262E012|nr:probable LRR receptor-like serine/threonine-protein kinase At1g56140 [Pistacia vera]
MASVLSRKYDLMVLIDKKVHESGWNLVLRKIFGIGFNGPFLAAMRLPLQNKLQAFLAQSLQIQAKKFKTMVVVVDASYLARLWKHWNNPIPNKVKDLIGESITSCEDDGETSNHMDKKRLFSNELVVVVGAGATTILGASSLTKLLPTSTFMKDVTFKFLILLKLFLAQAQKAIAIALGNAKVFAPGLATSGSNTYFLKVVTSAEKIQLLVLDVAQAQAQAQATTSPREVAALNIIFKKWGISANQNQWNISGEPCSGAAIDYSIDLHTDGYSPFIKCDCSYNKNTLCHIIGMSVYTVEVDGVIPDELNVTGNSFSGSLSPSMGNLTALKILDFSVNRFSGQLPKELGMLFELQALNIGRNNFSGPLPSELGNLTKLKDLYIDSAGVSGEIPSSFANLKNLELLWAFDNEFTGRIPDFIGNWPNMEELRFQGNSFQGPIPSSFSKLTNLTDLIISDLSNGSSSSLAFIRNLKSLTTLVLRNNKISDSIPSNIIDYQSLQHLDLSFNNISGQIPISLFSLSSLAYLFLGNNRLNGTLPAEKSPKLLNIDVSYNNLSGSLPSWIQQQNLQFNLVANNFNLESSNSSSVLPYSLNCLQRNFPCNRGSGIYSSFAINCADQTITSHDIVYESDIEPLGPATYYLTDTNRWGVSNVGYFIENNNLQYKINSASTVTNTQELRLFQSARISASSLRYYGLGLQNGKYTVTLHFAELANLTSKWGRRVFDIYLQENLVEKDFDITRVAGGVLGRAVQREYLAQVSENYMEIHLFWAGKGTCCIPDTGTYGPSISAISVTPDFEPSQITEKNRIGLIVGIIVVLGVVFLLLAIFFVVQRRKRPQMVDNELLDMDVRPYTFSYVELKTATEDFSSANKLGEGGYGSVYKGILSDGRLIAVKQLSIASRHGKSQFTAEIAIISAVQHRNLVKLHGCCFERAQRILVYEYLENNSLDKALFGKGSLHLDWSMRYNICLGVARGLAYLHEESRLRVIHRDVKASNILLDGNLIPKISDFGLAKLYDDQKTHISTRVAGTIGYLAPEYAMRGYLTEKTDVFAFGIVILEVVSGRPNSDSSLEEEKMYLLDWAWHLYKNNRQLELVDSKLSEFCEEKVKSLIGVALLCTQTLPSSRPSMSRVIAMLCGDMEVSTINSKPGYLTEWAFDDVTTFVSDDINEECEEASHYISSTRLSTTDKTPEISVAEARLH